LYGKGTGAIRAPINTGWSKKCPNFFLSEIHQISTKFANFGIRMAKTIELCKVYSFFTLPNSCQCTTCKTLMLQIVTLCGDFQYQIAHLFIQKRHRSPRDLIIWWY